MKLSILDKNNNQIDTNVLYYDTKNNVRDIQIVLHENGYRAHQKGLDSEPLEKVCHNLVPH